MTTPVIDSPVPDYHSSLLGCINELLGRFLCSLAPWTQTRMQIKRDRAFNLTVLSLSLRLITSNQNWKIELNEPVFIQHVQHVLNAKTLCRETKRASIITPPLRHTQLHKCVFVIEPEPSRALLMVAFRSLHQSLVMDETIMMTLASTVTVVHFKPVDEKEKPNKQAL